MSVFDFDAPLSEEQIIRNALRNVTMERDNLADSIKSTDDEIRHLEALMQKLKMEFEAKYRELFEQKVNLQDEIKDTKIEIARKTKEISNLERELALFLQRQASSRAFQEQADNMKMRTMQFEWRKHAKPHQVDGATILAMNNKCILADKMGLGKTLTALAACDMMMARRVLVIVPSDIVRNFESEARRWSPHRSVVAMYKMSKVERNALIQILSMGDPSAELMVIINYEIWRKDSSLVDQLINMRFDTVILDEAHAIKNATTSAFTGVEKIIMAENVCPKCSSATETKWVSKYGSVTQCVKEDWSNHDTDFNWEVEDRRSVKNVIPMTGTPILNKPQELFPMLHLILPRIFHDERQFLDMYCRQNYDGKWEFRPGGLDQMKHHLKGRYLMRDRHSAGVILPPQEIKVHEIEFDTERYPLQWKFIQQLKQYSQIVLGDGKSLSALAAITMILRLRQMNVWPGGIQMKDKEGITIFSVADEVNESIKIDKAVELIEDAGDDRIVLFSQFKPPLREIQRRLEKLGISAVVFDGDTPEYIREQIKADFNRSIIGDGPYKWQVVLANYKTGGVGLNFTAATELIVLDEEWNPGKNEQAYGRIDRIGQTEETTVHILRVKNTIDTWMAKLNAQKAAIVEGFEQEGEDISKAMLEALNNGELFG